MNVYIKKIENYLVAKSKFLVATLVMVNLSLWFFISQQKTEWVGSIETPIYHWSTFTQQRMNTIDMSVTYTEHGIEKGFSNSFDYEHIASNEYISYNSDMKIKFYRQRVYALDDECYLVFRGRTLMQIHNVSMRCLLL